MRSEIEQVLSNKATKAEKVRALVGLGVPKPEIATLLAISANHVYTVIARDRANGRAILAKPPVSEQGDYVHMIAIDRNGCMILPPQALDLMGIKTADQLVMLGSPGELRLLTKEKAARQLHAAIAKSSPTEAALARTLLSDLEK